MKSNNSIVQKQISDLLRSQNGRFVSVTFYKKDGSKRVLNGRLNVQKHLRGGTSTTSHIPNLVTVWDRQKLAYRSINLETVESVKASGNEYQF